MEQIGFVCEDVTAQADIVEAYADFRGPVSMVRMTMKHPPRGSSADGDDDEDEEAAREARDRRQAAGSSFARLAEQYLEDGDDAMAAEAVAEGLRECPHHVDCERLAAELEALREEDNRQRAAGGSSSGSIAAEVRERAGGGITLLHSATHSRL